MHLTITKTNKTLVGEIKLPSSKSISNRILIINALSYSPYEIGNLSDSDDTKVLDEVLNSNINTFDIGHAGTAMRFLTAFLSKVVGEWILTGSERMKQRPIGILVNALRELGASIEYTEKEGFPPLKITGAALKGGTIELDGSVSSQYISALLMIAPTVQGGLRMKLLNQITSGPYLNLTLNLMKLFGIQYSWEANEIVVAEQNYKPIPYSVEADWSGASYWYALAALSENCNLLLEGLQLKSLQGDSMQAEWFSEYFGIQSAQESKGVRLTKKSTHTPQILNLDFIENPDIAQTFAVLCVCKGLPFYFKGLHTLKIKETDRISALKAELAKLGANLIEPRHGALAWDGRINAELKKEAPLIRTYHDHRMALAFATASLSLPSMQIDDPMVITKSYPTFYDDLKKIGFYLFFG